MFYVKTNQFNRSVVIASTIFSLIFLYSVQVIAFELEWATEIEDYAFYLPRKTFLDAEGNVYVSISRKSDHGGDHLAIRLLKLNSDGEILWTTEFDDEMYEARSLGEFHCKNIVYDAVGNAYLSCMDMDFRVYFMKVSTEGEFEWVLNLNEIINGRNKGFAVQFDADNNLLVTVKVYTRQVVTIHFLWYSPEGELLRRTQHAPNVFFEPIFYDPDEDGILVTGYIPPMAQDDTPIFRMHKYDFNGEILWENNFFVGPVLHCLPSSVLVSDGRAYVTWSGNNLPTSLLVLDLAEQEVIWELRNLPCQSSPMSPLVANDIDGFIYGGGGLPIYGGGITYQIDPENERIRWQRTETWDDDRDHLNGSTLHRLPVPGNGVFVTGFALCPDDSGGFLAPRDLLLIQYDSDGNRVDHILDGVEDWRSLDGYKLTYDREGSIIVAAKKLTPNRMNRWDMTYEIRKYSIGVLQSPELRFPENELAFPENYVNETVTADLVITNEGQGSGRIERIEFDEDLQDIIAVENPIPMRIQPDSERTLTFSWTPQEEGELNGQIRIFHNDEELDNPFVVNPNGQAGAQRFPDISIPIHELLFDVVIIGNSATSIIEITNDGDGYGVIDSIDFEDVNPDEISVLAEFPFNLEPQSTDSIAVTWTPMSEMELDGILTLYHNDENVENPLEIVLAGEALSVERIKPDLPNDISISISPNPFNSRTIIRYTIQRTSDVILTVVDFRGRSVSSLVEGRIEAGIHEVVLTADYLPAGIYFAKLDAEGKSQIKKMALVK